MPRKPASELRPGDRVRRGTQFIEVAEPPPEPVRVYFNELDDGGNVIGSGSTIFETDEEVETE